MKCLICGDQNWEYLFPARDRMFGIAGKFSEYRCGNCGFVRLDPQPSRKELPKYYPSTHYYSYSAETKRSFFGSIRSYMVTHLYQPTFFSRVLESFLRVPAMPRRIRKGKILDIGCGSGDTLSLLQSVGWECYGLDIDTHAIDAAHKRGLKHAALGSYEAMKKYQDNFFDVIRLYHVIEHLPDPSDCLKLARKKLKPGGEIIIGTPNIGSIIARIARQYWYNLDCPRHLYLFTPFTLRKLLQKNNWTVFNTTFCSAGGWIGSIQYIIKDKLADSIDLINQPILIMLFYPLEWVLDKLNLGDVFVVRATK